MATAAKTQLTGLSRSDIMALYKSGDISDEEFDSAMEARETAAKEEGKKEGGKPSAINPFWKINPATGWTTVYFGTGKYRRSASMPVKVLEYIRASDELGKDLTYAADYIPPAYGEEPRKQPPKDKLADPKEKARDDGRLFRIPPKKD